MAQINSVTQLTQKKYLNLFEIDGINSKGHHSHYLLASRSSSIKDLKLSTKRNTGDGVAIYCLYGEKRDKVVLERQYRYPIDRFVYEFPAGLVEAGESFKEAAVRELHEETGLTLIPLSVDSMLESPRYTSVGMSDESVATVYGYADGKISGDYMESSEEIQIVLADKAEIERILREEQVAIICAYQLMHFLHDKEPFGFLKPYIK